MTDTGEIIGLPHTHALPSGDRYYCTDRECADPACDAKAVPNVV